MKGRTMATKKKVKRLRRPLSGEVSERLLSLDDAVHAAMDSIGGQVGDSGATALVSTALFSIAANIAWHATAATEEDFVFAARECYRKIAAAHAHCKRGDHTEHAEPRQRREDLN